MKKTRLFIFSGILLLIMGLFVGAVAAQGLPHDAP